MAGIELPELTDDELIEHLFLPEGEKSNVVKAPNPRKGRTKLGIKFYDDKGSAGLQPYYTSPKRDIDVHAKGRTTNSPVPGKPLGTIDEGYEDRGWSLLGVPELTEGPPDPDVVRGHELYQTVIKGGTDWDTYADFTRHMGLASRLNPDDPDALMAAWMDLWNNEDSFKEVINATMSSEDATALLSGETTDAEVIAPALKRFITDVYNPMVIDVNRGPSRAPMSKDQKKEEFKKALKSLLHNSRKSEGNKVPYLVRVRDEVQARNAGEDVGDFEPEYVAGQIRPEKQLLRPKLTPERANPITASLGNPRAVKKAMLKAGFKPKYIQSMDYGASPQGIYKLWDDQWIEQLAEELVNARPTRTVSDEKVKDAKAN